MNFDYKVEKVVANMNQENNNLAFRSLCVDGWEIINIIPEVINGHVQSYYCTLRKKV